MTASPFLAWLLENLVWTSAAMLLVLAIRRPVAATFGAGAAYALWLIPLCRLLAPPADWFSAWLATPLPSLPQLIVLVDDGAGAAPLPLDGSGQWAPILLAVWAGGAFLFLALQAVRYRLFLARLTPLADAGTHRGVPLVTSEAAEGPLALGLIHRRIVLPADFSRRYTAEEQRLALDHEAYHHRRRDILTNHFALAILALNWCNPLAWLAFRAFRADQELSCDAAIASSATPEERSDYARALVKSASPPGLVSACPLNGADQLKRRLKMLNRHRREPRRLLAGSAIAVSLAAVSLTIGAPGLAQPASPAASGQTSVRIAAPAAPGAAEVRRLDVTSEFVTVRERPTERSDQLNLVQEPARDRTRVIIMDRREGGEASTTERTERREIRIRRNSDGTITTEGLDPEMQRRIEGCRDGNNELVNLNEGNNSQHTRVVICSRGGNAGTTSVETLQRARERIAGNDDMSAETKQRVLAELDRAIARARSGN